MKCWSERIEPLPRNMRLYRSGDVGRHLYDPTVSNLARTFLSAVDSRSEAQAVLFSRTLLAVIIS